MSVVKSPPKPTLVCALRGLASPKSFFTSAWVLASSTSSLSMVAAASVPPASGPWWMVSRMVKRNGLGGVASASASAFFVGLGFLAFGGLGRRAAGVAAAVASGAQPISSVTVLTAPKKPRSYWRSAMRTSAVCFGNSSKAAS
jgi:hypothetical protein